tara:strand:+ start:520 stop:669 length:150 start_codon:yes stop_codon:yes gene_type:complete
MLQALPRLLAPDLSALIFKFYKQENLFEINFFFLIDQSANTQRGSNPNH